MIWLNQIRGSDRVSLCLLQQDRRSRRPTPHRSIAYRLTARACQLITTMPPGYHQELGLCRLPRSIRILCWRRATWPPLSHKHQLTEQQLWRQATTCRPRTRITILIQVESNCAVHHRPASSRRLSRRRSVPETHSRPSCRDPIDYVLLFS